MCNAIQERIQKALETRAAASDGLRIQSASDLLRDAGSIDLRVKQVFQMEFWILDIVRFRSIDTSQTTFHVSSKVLGISEIPRFKMPLSVSILQSRSYLWRQASVKLFSQ